MDAQVRATSTGGRSALPDGTAADRRGANWPRYQPLVSVVIAVAAGIAADRYSGIFLPGDAPGGVPWFAFWWVMSAGALAVWRLAWRAHRNALGAWPLLFAAAFAGAAWHHAQWNLRGWSDCSRYASYDPSPVCIEAIALETPARIPAAAPTPLRAIPGGDRSRGRVRVVRIRDGLQWRPASGAFQLSVEGHLLAVHPGDRIRVFGQLSRISPPLNPGEFDFATHARADGELVRVFASAPECVSVLARASLWRPGRFVLAIRDNAKRLVQRLVGPEHADLAGAILLGARGGLTREELEPYLLTGTVHVLVVSGMNVAILTLGFYMLIRLGWLPRRTGLAIVMAAAVGYAAVAEAQPPVLRAAVFAVLVCIGAWTGRSGVVFNSLAATALTVLMVNPSELFRAGPQLSFLAVCALIWIGDQGDLIRRRPVDPLDQLLAATRPWYVRGLAWFGRKVGWLFFASFVVWLVTLPLLLNQFHFASPVSVVISPMLWVIVFVAMWSGFLMLAVGWLLPAVGAWSGAICGWSLAALEQLVHWAHQLPGGHFFAPGPAWWWILVFYIALLVTIVRGRDWIAPRWQVAALCAWILIGVAPPLFRATQRDVLECSFVAVGHGACVVLETPAGETLLYDAGSLGSPEFATQAIASYLWSRGIARIDGIVISHADIDHYNAVPGLLDRFTVGAVYVSPMMFDGIDDSETLGPQVLRDALHTAGVPIREVWSGDRLRLGPATTLQVLHPPQVGVVGSDNANSIMLAIEHAGRRVLLPGDLESPGIEDVMAEEPYDCDVLLAPHHGSRHSDPPGFAAWSTPNWVVISGGGSDDLRSVVRTYERSGAAVLLTHERGAVRFSISEGPMKMTSWHAKPRN